MTIMNSETWIIFHAEPEQPGWETRKLPMGGLTDILDEQLDYTEKGSIPKLGDRLRQFLRIPDFASERFPESSTHVRDGDWVVTRVESYSPNYPDCSKREIVVCYCSFDPIISQLEPLGDVSGVVLLALSGDIERAMPTSEAIAR